MRKGTNSDKNNACKWASVNKIKVFSYIPQEMSEGDKIFAKCLYWLTSSLSYNQSVSKKGWVQSEQLFGLRVWDWLPWTDCVCLAAQSWESHGAAVRAQSARQPFACASGYGNDMEKASNAAVPTFSSQGFSMLVRCS
jgi:hypothetical protein